MMYIRLQSRTLGATADTTVSFWEGTQDVEVIHQESLIYN